MRPASTPALHPAYARLLLMQLRRHGLDAEFVLAEAGLVASELEGDQNLIDRERLRRLVTSALRASGRPWLGLEFGAAVPVLSHGPLGLAASASGNLAEALALIARFLGVRAPLLRLEVSRVVGGLWARFEVEPDLGEVRMFVLEAALVMLERLLQGLCARDFALARIELPWPRPAWARHYSAFLVSPLRFDARAARLWLPDTLARAACLSSDPAALAFARAECERRLAQANPRLDFVAALRRRLQACEGDYPDAPQMAAKLGLSPRSFFRRLADEGLRWRSLLDEARCARALQLLRETDLPVEQIAGRLGYADASNFSRCLRRWCGRSARELRAERRDALPEPQGPAPPDR